jgi:cobalamin biosynthetic protein CobC
VDHGGSLARARALFPDAPEPFVDLSTGINPHSYPLFSLPATALTRLPEASRLAELLGVASATYGAPSPANVVAAPGTQILLPRVAALVARGRAAVLGPTYAEHARAAAIAGHATAETAAFEDLTDADLAIVVNPNNPDGRVVPRAQLLWLAERMKAKGGLLVVDEAFMDVGLHAESLAGEVEEGGVVVLRSFGKFYGLAGVRLGFALADRAAAARLAGELGPWAVAGPALEYGIAALRDGAWRADMQRTLAKQAARLDDLFGRFGVPVTGGTSLFRFIDFAGAAGLFATLGGQGVVLRHFAERPTVLRAGLPGCQEEWQRLENALALWAGQRDDRAARSMQ